MSAQKVTRFHGHSNTLTHTHVHNLWLKCVLAFSFRWLFHYDFPLPYHFAHLHFYEHFPAYRGPPHPHPLFLSHSNPRNACPLYAHTLNIH